MRALPASIMAVILCCASPAFAAPATPTNPSPGSVSSPGPVLSSSTVTVSWNASSGATFYGLGIRDIASGVLVVDTNVSATSYTASLTSGRQYRWNVAACNSTGCSLYTTVLFFQTPSAGFDLTGTAALTSTYSSGQSGILVPVSVFRSGGPLPTTASYVLARLYWSTNATWDGADTQLWESNGSTPDFPVSVLNSSGSKSVNATIAIPSVSAGTYYVILVTDPTNFFAETNEANNAAAYAVTIGATVVAPATPTNPSPGTLTSPGPTLSDSTVTVSWSASSGATFYGLGIRDIASGVLVVDTNVNSTSYTAALTAGRQYRWNVAACNNAGCSLYTTVRYFQTSAPQGLAITTASLASATVGASYTQNLSATAGHPPYTWSASNGLPPGLALDPTSGTITGNPTHVGTFTFTVTVRDSSNPIQTTSREFSIAVGTGSLWFNGRLVKDTNRNASKDVDEVFLQAPGASCTGGESQAGFTVNWSGPTAGAAAFNACNPQPYYTSGSLPAGTYTVSISVPAGWVVTGAASRTVILPAPSGQPDPWFYVVPETLALGPEIHSIEPAQVPFDTPTWLTVRGRHFTNPFNAVVAGYTIATAGLVFVNDGEVKVLVTMKGDPGGSSASVKIVTASGTATGVINVLAAPSGAAAVDVIDPYASGFVSDASLKNADVLSVGGTPARGVAADGVSRLLLRALPPTAATQVQFTILQPDGELGGRLSGASGGAAGKTIVVPIVSTVNGRRAYGLLLAPENFAGVGMDQSAPCESADGQCRTVRVQASFLAGTQLLKTVDLRLAIVRPPVLLVHGFLGSAWNDFKSLLGPELDATVEVVDYWDTDMAAFAINVPKYAGWIDQARARVAKRGSSANIAVAQVDVIAHSMGAVLARLYATSDPKYYDDANYKAGAFNRLISLDGAHGGSRLADVFSLLPAASNAQRKFFKKLPILRNHVSGADPVIINGAFFDLQPSSCELTNIPSMLVPSHVLVGYGGSEAVATAEMTLEVAISILEKIKPELAETLFLLKELLSLTNYVLFNDEDHDIAVTVPRQTAGLDGARVSHQHGFDSIHVMNGGSHKYADEVKRLLDVHPLDKEFAASFPGGYAATGTDPAKCSKAPSPALRTDASGPADSAPDFSLTVIGSTSTSAGESLQLVGTPAAGQTVAKMLLVAPGLVRTTTTAPFAFQIAVPVDWIGRVTLSALAKTDGGELLESNDVTIEVDPKATLLAIETSPGSMTLARSGDTQTISVVGLFSDGIRRSLNGSGRLQFSSSREESAVVDAHGLVTARDAGTATIEILSGASTASVAVQVQGSATPFKPQADAGPDQGVVAGSPVALIGKATNIPDGTDASYEWFQISGPAVELEGADRAVATFRPSLNGTYVFGLIVRAASYVSEPSTATVIVGPTSSPTVVLDPESQTTRVGDRVVFRTTAIGTPTPSYQWQVARQGSATFEDITDAGGYSGSRTSTLTILSARGSFNGNKYRVVATNSAGLVASDAATLSLTGPSMTLDQTALVFGATVTNADFGARTTPQIVRMLQTGEGVVTWHASSTAPWLVVSPTSGNGPTVLTISTRFTAGLAAQQSAEVVITVAGAINESASVLATLNVAAGAAPAGSFDTPVNGLTGVTGSIAVTGWAIDDVEVMRVRIVREAVAGEAPGTLVYIGDADFVEGARPDVAAVNSNLPLSTRAGWGYLLLTNFLPSLGNGTFRLLAYADDADGHTTLLGTKTITCSNSTATQPFGAIDTPAQGETVSGTLTNFGWVLSPKPFRADPAGGGTGEVVIDGGFTGVSPSGWAQRPDLSALFPAAQFPGIGTALGVAAFDTTALSNGVHTISWVVTDNAGAASGIGSRYFTVANSTSMTAAPVATPSTLSSTLLPILGRRGPLVASPFERLPAAVDGTPTLHAQELERIELRVHATAGRLRTPLGDRPLPIGSKIDPTDGTFTWQPGPGFLNTYDLVFDTPEGQRVVRIVLFPSGGPR